MLDRYDLAMRMVKLVLGPDLGIGQLATSVEKMMAKIEVVEDDRGE